MTDFVTPGKEINIGIIGLGPGHPQMQSWPRWRMCASGLCAMSAGTVDQAPSLLAGSRNGDARGFTEPAELLDLPGLQTVIIMTSWETHIPRPSPP